MAAELRIAPEAEQDIEEAYGWYERQRGGLGEEFLTCVDAPAFRQSVVPLRCMSAFTTITDEDW
jgi:hypothetical protein